MEKATRKAITTLALVLLAGCATGHQSLNMSKFYPRDMKLKVNGIRAHGVIVVPRADSYLIEGKSYGTLDLLTLTTCHRDVYLEDLGSDFQHQYTPNPEMEDDCGMLIGGYDKKDGRHSWGYVEFESPTYQLPAKVSCNGGRFDFGGVSICQALAGTKQSIAFAEPVKISPDPKCPLPSAQNGQTFRFSILRGECVYVFMGQGGKFHKMTTIGYDSVLLKEN